MEVVNNDFNNPIIKSSALNEHFQCGICEGYLIDATTITQCFHSFCKSCIVHFIENIDNRCPTCNTSLNDTKNCIRYDSSLQRLIYKAVPNLLENELKRRDAFVMENSSCSKLVSDQLTNNTLLNIKLFNTQNHEYFNALNKMNSKENVMNTDFNNNNIRNGVRIKYIQCIAVTPIKILIKLLRNKYSIPFNYNVIIFCLINLGVSRTKHFEVT